MPSASRGWLRAPDATDLARQAVGVAGDDWKTGAATRSPRLLAPLGDPLWWRKAHELGALNDHSLSVGARPGSYPATGQ